MDKANLKNPGYWKHYRKDAFTFISEDKNVMSTPGYILKQYMFLPLRVDRRHFVHSLAFL